MDDTLCDFRGAFNRSKTPELIYPQSKYGFFLGLKPINGAVDAFIKLSKHHDVYILTRPSIKNPLCYTEKRIWVENHLGMEACERLIITPNKSLNKGDYLIDDVKWEFEGKQLLFGSEQYPDWESILKYFGL